MFTLNIKEKRRIIKIAIWLREVRKISHLMGGGLEWKFFTPKKKLPNFVSCFRPFRVRVI